MAHELTKQTGTKHLEDTKYFWGLVHNAQLNSFFSLLLSFIWLFLFFLVFQFVCNKTRDSKRKKVHRMHQEQEKMWTDDSKSLETYIQTKKKKIKREFWSLESTLLLLFLVLVAVAAAFFRYFVQFHHITNLIRARLFCVSHDPWSREHCRHLTGTMN